MKTQVKFPLFLLLSILVSVGSASAMDGDAATASAGAEKPRERSASEIERAEVRADEVFTQDPAKLRAARNLYNLAHAAAKPCFLVRSKDWVGARFADKATGAKTVATLVVVGGAGYLGRDYLGSAARVIGGGIKGAATGAVAGVRGDK
jgi:hypothetical protein